MDNLCFSAGIKPFFEITMEDIIKVFPAFQAMVRSNNTILNWCIMDRDFDYQARPLLGQESFSKFNLYQPLMKAAVINGYPLSEHTRVHLRTILDFLSAEYFNVNISQQTNIVIFSELSQNQDFIQFFMELVVKKKTVISTILFDTHKQYYRMLSPICPDCATASARLRKHDVECNDGYEWKAKCLNPLCATSEYSFNLLDPFSCNIYYLINVLRDLYRGSAMRTTNIRLFGNTYLRPYGRKKTTRVDRITELFHQCTTATGIIPQVYCVANDYGLEGKRKIEIETSGTIGQVVNKQQFLSDVDRFWKDLLA